MTHYGNQARAIEHAPVHAAGFKADGEAGLVRIGGPEGLTNGDLSPTDAKRVCISPRGGILRQLMGCSAATATNELRFWNLAGSVRLEAELVAVDRVLRRDLYGERRLDRDRRRTILVGDYESGWDRASRVYGVEGNGEIVIFEVKKCITAFQGNATPFLC